jgi:coproporphyrinogen III oxidase
MRYSTAPEAIAARALVDDLQRRLVGRLQRLGATFTPVEWLRDGGAHGGGVRFQTADAPFDRASVNVSAVHYDDLPDRPLASATALSSIVHPRHPRAPSVHLHVSFTAMRAAPSYWRIMADLNPSHPDDADRAAFESALRAAAPAHYESARDQGDRYFWIPALNRHRGVTHFYLEDHRTPDAEADARAVAEAAIDAYAALLERPLPPATDAERAAQLAYHTLYLFQVLTLDRGTTSGLMVHADNDVGTLGSLPSRVDRELLRSWAARVPEPQPALVEAIAAALPPDGSVTEDAKRALAAAVRAHYRAHPEALGLQAAGPTIHGR